MSIRHVYDTAANLASDNPTLGAGEWGIESDTLKTKIGDGVTAWNSLPYMPSASDDPILVQKSDFMSWQNSPTSAAPATSGVRPPVWTLSPSAPDDAIMGAVDPRIRGWGTWDVYLWTLTMSAVASGGARLLMSMAEAADGESSETTVWSTGSGYTATITGGTAQLLQRHLVASGAGPASANHLQYLYVYRVSTDAADTYGGEIGIAGVEFVRAS